MSFVRDGGKKGGHYFVPIIVVEFPLIPVEENEKKSELVRCTRCGMVGIRDLKDKGFIYVGEEYDTCDNHI